MSASSCWEISFSVWPSCCFFFCLVLVLFVFYFVWPLGLFIRAHAKERSSAKIYRQPSVMEGLPMCACSVPIFWQRVTNTGRYKPMLSPCVCVCVCAWWFLRAAMKERKQTLTMSILVNDLWWQSWPSPLSLFLSLCISKALILTGDGSAPKKRGKKKKNSAFLIRGQRQIASSSFSSSILCNSFVSLHKRKERDWICTLFHSFGLKILTQEDNDAKQLEGTHVPSVTRLG